MSGRTNPGTEFAREVKLRAGSMPSKVEYYEYGYDAKSRCGGKAQLTCDLARP